MTDAEHRVAKWALTLGCALIAGLAAVVVVAVAGMAVGATVGAWLVVPGVVGFAALAAVAWRGTDRVGSRIVTTVAACVVMVSACALVASLASDTSVDDRHYHAEAVWALADGWNPITDVALAHPADQGTDRINSFPKALWILEATVLDAGGGIEDRQRGSARCSPSRRVLSRSESWPCSASSGGGQASWR